MTSGTWARGAWLAAAVVVGFAAAGIAQDEGGEAPAEDEVEVWPPEIPGVEWEAGPTSGRLGSIAEVAVPGGWNFVGENGAGTLMQLMENPLTGRELGVVFPGKSDWFCVFEFDPSGYVKDEDKDDLDADAMLESIREGNEAGNAARRERGWSTMEIEGWYEPPNYDAATNNLQWGTRARSEGYPIVNYNVRLLGRRGVMEVTLVGDPEELDAAMPEFRSFLSGFGFSQGERYAEFREGDKVAEYGLAALITGGALAAAVKTGFLKKFWKLILVALVAVGGFFKKLFGGGKSEKPRRRRSRGKIAPPSEPPAE